MNRFSQEACALVLAAAGSVSQCGGNIDQTVPLDVADGAPALPGTGESPPPSPPSPPAAEAPTSPPTAPPPPVGTLPPPPAGTLPPPPAADSVPESFNVPTGRPRLWWNAERLERAKAWYAAHPFSPKAGNATELAFHALVSGNQQSCRAAINIAMGVTFSVDVIASNPARWEGENVILTYDWCHDVMTPAERQTLIDRWNGYVEGLNAKPWGAVGMEGNNYYIGYLRNAFEWAVATWGENPKAESILTHALGTRWKRSFLPYANTVGSGGVPLEGSQYGRGVMFYWTVPLVTAAINGRPMWDETAYFRESIWYLIYSMTTAKSPAPNNPAQLAFETFPFNEDERWRDGGTGARTLGDYLVPLMEQWQSSPLAGYIQRYMEVAEVPVVSKWIEAVRKPVAARSFESLPLDYYAPGAQFFYTKNSWAPDATIVNLQLATPVGLGHEHLDAGTFQIWRKGRWVSRESVGYANNLAGWQGAQQDCRVASGHNSVMFNGVSVVDGRGGRPKTFRLESRPTHSYAAVDLTDGMHAPPNRDENRFGNPYGTRAIREFLFVKPLETLVVFDRLEAANRVMPATNVPKTFVTHFEQNPTVEDATHVTGVNGDQALRVTTLLPAGAASRVVSEGGKVGQYRLEVTSTGTGEVNFLHVLQAKDASAPNVEASVTETGDGYEVTLRHPTKGSAVFTVKKGMTSSAGTFGYAASGAPTPAPLPDGMQSMSITDAGPVWQ